MKQIVGAQSQERPVFSCAQPFDSTPARGEIGRHFSGLGMQRFIFGLVASLFALTPANATIVWDWSFNGEAGTFQTDGTATANVAPPGQYTLQNFTVTSSAAGAGLGSLTGGQYGLIGITYSGPGGPTAFDWNGSSVTEWDRVGEYSEWVFLPRPGWEDVYVFGGKVGAYDPTSAYLVVFGSQPISEGTLSITVADAVPEPSTWAMMILGFLGLGWLAYRRKNRFAPQVLP
jgi:PEP-CTERM motif